MKTIFLTLTLLFPLLSAAGGIDGCKRCYSCVDPNEKAICMSECGPNQLPRIDCRVKPTNAFLLLNQDGPPYYCVIGKKGFWCDSENCSKCTPARP